MSLAIQRLLPSYFYSKRIYPEQRCVQRGFLCGHRRGTGIRPAHLQSLGTAGVPFRQRPTALEWPLVQYRRRLPGRNVLLYIPLPLGAPRHGSETGERGGAVDEVRMKNPSLNSI